MAKNRLETSDDIDYHFMAREVRRTIYDWAEECIVADGYGFFTLASLGK